MGGSSTTNTTSSQQSVNEIPQWVQNAGQANYGLAQQVASQPLQQYQGQMVAGVSPQTQQAWDLAANSGNVGVPSQNAAQAAFLNAANYSPNQVQAGQLSNANLFPYMNPYTQDVIDKTLPIMQQGLALQQNQQQNAASAANAYGGNRQAIQQAVTQAQGAQNQAQMAAQLNQANFAQAQAAATGDINRTMQADIANQGAGLTANQQKILAGSGLGTLGTQQMQNNVANFGMLGMAGGQEQAQAQNDINAQIAKFQQAWQYPQTQLGMMESALGMTPYNTGTSGTSASTSETQTSNPVGNILSGAQILGGLFATSDRRLKTDIRRIDTHPTGVPIFSYRYKGDPKSYPKVAGPMAEDVMKIAPHAVRPMGVKGRLAVHMPTLDALATPPSTPGVARAIGMLAPSGASGRLSPFATPPMGASSGGFIPRMKGPRIPITGALSGGR